MTSRILSLALAGVLASGGAWAQEAPASDPAPRGTDDALKIENGAFVIEGKVQKPEVVVVIRRESLEEGLDLELKESFLQEIVDATQEPPF